MSVKTPKSLRAYYDSERFEKEYLYDGPLGPDYTREGTRLRLWAPTAEQVMVNLYRQGDKGFCIGSLTMERREHGCWTIYLPGDQHGLYYTFSVRVNGQVRETGDPYARAAGVNGTRSMIVDLRRTDPSGWQFDRRPVIPPSRRVIWEVSVRDFSWDPDGGFARPWRGKYLAFTQEGTTLAGDNVRPTGLNYLRRLGVSHVQLMPVFDYGSVPEDGSDAFNWGYDPVNYNVPEGSYATDPNDGAVRIRELKEAIQALHQNGFRVIMDVVYNHTYKLDSWLWRTEPWYFYRQNPDGSPADGSGCGNDLASERSMCARYILESVLYWAREYHMDGFRFDLMALLDTQLMERIRAALDREYGKGEKILFGEPWSAHSSPMHRGAKPAGKRALPTLDENTGAFCDATRDLVKGHILHAERPGFVNGGSARLSSLSSLLLDLKSLLASSPRPNAGSVNRLLASWGAPSQMVGVVYLRESVCLALQYDSHFAIRKDILQEVGDWHTITDEAVDSGIRRLIDALDRKKAPAWLSFRQRHHLPQGSKLTTGTFIYEVRDELLSPPPAPNAPSEGEPQPDEREPQPAACV